MKVSIVVPVYNAEKYLTKCVSSILAQTYRDLEIILVDDGSTDSSGEICDSFAQSDKRIRTLHKENGGVSSARNMAIDIAMGDFIVFVDSDDYIHPEYVEYLLSLCIENQCKEAQVSYRYVHDDFGGQNSGGIHVEKKWSFVDLFFSPSRNYRAIVCGKIFSSDLFDHYRFPTGRIYEDEEAAFYLSYYAQNIIVSDRPMYFYRMSENSIMRNSQKSINWDFLYNYKGIISFLENKGERILLDGVRKELCVRLLSRYIEGKRNNTSSDELRKLILEYNKQFSKIVSFKLFPFREMVALFTFRVFPNFFAYLENKTGIILKVKKHRVQNS